MARSALMFLRLFLCATALLCSGLAAATDSVQSNAQAAYYHALTAFNTGDFEQAFIIVTDISDEGLSDEDRVLKYIMAAEILSARVMLGDTSNPKEVAKDARDYAQTALGFNPNHQYARLQYVVADGLVTRLTSPFKVLRKKLSSKLLVKIKNYRTAYPDDPRGQALHGAWHLGVIEKAGAKNGKKWFKASKEEGVRLYESAFKDAPNDTLIAASYFLALASICNDEAARVDDRLTSLSRQIADMPSSTALERAMKKFIEDLTPLIGQHKAMEKSARAILSGKPI